MQLTPDSSATDLTNNFTVTVDGESMAGQTVTFALFSLFPPTWEGQSNGMRMDLAQVGDFPCFNLHRLWRVAHELTHSRGLDSV